MTPVLSAILEISTMLLIAFGLGALLIQYRWKPKYQQLFDQLTSLQQDHDQLTRDHGATVTDFEKHKQESAAALEDLVKKLALEKSRRERIEAEKAEELEKYQTEKTALISNMEKQIQQLRKTEQGRDRERELKEVEVSRLNQEIESLRKELEGLANAPRKKRTQRYYRTIGDKKYDDAALRIAEKAVSGAGDGRISKGDVDALFEAIADNNQYTDIEKATVKYIREHFTWTPAADELFRQKIRDWARERSLTDEN